MKKVVNIVMISFVCLTLTVKQTVAQTYFQKAYNHEYNTTVTGFEYAYMNSMIEIDDNKFIVSGNLQDEAMPGMEAYLSCLDSLGSVIWSKRYGGDSDDEFLTSLLLVDGDLISAGSTYTGPGGKRDCYIVKTDMNGNLVWTKSFGASFLEQINGIQEDALGNIYCVGSGNTNSGSKSFLIKFDSNGNLIWEKNYSIAGNVFFDNLKFLPSGDLLIIGYAYFNGLNQGILLKVDASGSEIWNKMYSNSHLSFDDVIVLPNGEIMMCGLYDLDYGMMLKTDASGNIIWSKKSNNSDSYTQGILLADDNNSVYAVGYHLISYPERQATLSKFSLSGSLLWEKEYGSCNEERFTHIFTRPSSVYLGGLTRSYGIGNTSTFIVRSDTSGYTSCFDDSTTTSYSNLILTPSSVSITLGNPTFAYASHVTAVNSIPIVDSLICTSLNPVGVRFYSNDTVICAGSCISFFSDSTVMHQGYNPLFGSELTYQWSFPGATPASDTLENPINVCYANPGQYNVSLIVTDGCKIDTLIKEKYILVTDASPELNFSGDSSLCDGGIAQLVVSGAKTYSWSPTTGLDNPTNDTIIATPTQTTTYTVTGSLGGSCIGTKDVTVTVGNAVMSDAGANDTICSGESATLIGSGGQTFTWSSNQITRTIIVSPVTTTDYIFTAIDGSCDDTDTVEVFVKETPIVTITPENTEVEQGSTVNLEASGGGTYSWSPSIGLSCDTCATTIATPLSSTNYCVTVTSTNGCEADKCVNITVTYNCGELFVPNSFSPNGDNINDKLEVKINPACISEYSLQIFDRWGELVFEATKITDLWDGKFDGKELDNATFVYYLKVKLINSQNSIIKKGNINLIR